MCSSMEGFKRLDVAGFRFGPGRGVLRTCQKAIVRGQAFAEAGSCVPTCRCAPMPMRLQQFEPGSKQTTDCSQLKQGIDIRRTFRGG